MSSGKEIFNALNEQLEFATEGNDKKSIYKEVIEGQAWLYFGMADKDGGPYIGLWVDDNIGEDSKNALKEALAQHASGKNYGEIIEYESWLYCSVEENTPSAEEVISFMEELKNYILEIMVHASEEEPSAAPVTTKHKSVFSRIFFWFKFSVVAALIVIVVAAFLPEFTVRNVGPEELLSDAEFAPRYKEAFELDRARSAPSGLFSVLKSASTSSHVYRLKWEFYEKKNPVLGAVMNESHIKAFILKMNGGFRFVALAVLVVVMVAFVISSGLADGWAKQRKVVGRRTHKDGSVETLYE